MRADHSWPQQRQLYQATTQVLSGVGSTSRPQTGHDIVAVAESIMNMPHLKGNDRAAANRCRVGPLWRTFDGEARNYKCWRGKLRSIETFASRPVPERSGGTAKLRPFGCDREVSKPFGVGLASHS